MTVSTDTGRQQWIGNGVTTAFDFSSRILDATHLQVVRTVIATGVDTPLILNDAGANGFSVSGVGNAFCTITVVTAPKLYSGLGGERLTIYRDVPLTQTSDYVDNDPFPAQSHENALDKLTMIEQQQQDSLDRSLKFAPSTSTDLAPTLPTPQDGYALTWDGVTGKMKNGISVGDIATASAAATTAVAAAVTSTANAALTAADRAVTASYAAALTSQSSSSNTIGTGSKSFTLSINKAFVANQFFSAIDNGNSANTMSGVVTSYNATTGAFVGTVTDTSGSGTISSWTVSVSGSRGATGATGAPGAGTGDIVGPAAAVDSEMVIYNSTTGKLVKRFAGTGFVKALTGVVSAVASISLTDLAAQAANSITANATAGSASPTAVTVALNKLVGRGASGNLGEITLGTNLSMSGTTLNASSSVPVNLKYANFNGTTGTLNNSYGISSVTRNSTGNYTINFTAGFGDAYYSCSHSLIPNSGDAGLGNRYSEAMEIVSKTASSINVIFFQVSGANNFKYAIDPAEVNIHFMGS